MSPVLHQHLKACGKRRSCTLPSVGRLVFEATPDSFDKACLCRLIWDSGLACIAVASLCSSIGALCIKLLDGRIPVFEIVVRLFTEQNCFAPCCLCTALSEVQVMFAADGAQCNQLGSHRCTGQGAAYKTLVWKQETLPHISSQRNHGSNSDGTVL